MPYDPDRHHRRSIRLQGYDYTQAGAYAVTICIHERACLLGDVVEGEMQLSAVGEIVLSMWEQLPERFSMAELDAFVVMPNHVHGIVVIGDSKQGAASSAPTLGHIMRAFKSISGIAGNRLLERSELPFWQRNYYEHIIRDEADLNRIREYIICNPARWSEDSENPAAKP